MTFIFQLVIYLIFFTATIAVVVKNGPVGGIFFYPKPVQDRAVELGLTDPETVGKRKKRFMIALIIGVVVLPLLFIGVWNQVTDFKTAFVQSLILLEAMNWYDGIVIDGLWVGFSKFWVIKGAEDLPYKKSPKDILVKRTIYTFMYALIAAVIAWLAMLIGRVV